MARQPRFFVPGVPQHIIQRGNNRQPIVAVERDYSVLLDCLAHACRMHGVRIHAYVLMTNHLHLLATPDRATSLPKTLQSVGRRYVQYFNCMHHRTGTLWEGRYRATVVDSECYLLTCMRYIELNPVSGGIVNHPSRYRWSSYHANSLGAADPLVSSHELYDRLGRSDKDRREAYRQLFDCELSPVDIEAIRHATNKNWALGDDGFRRSIEQISGRRSAPSRRGPSAGARRTEIRV